MWETKNDFRIYLVYNGTLLCHISKLGWTNGTKHHAVKNCTMCHTLLHCGISQECFVLASETPLPQFLLNDSPPL